MFFNFLSKQLVFFVSVLLLVYCALSCFAHSASGQTPASNSSELFKGNKVEPVKSKPSRADDKSEKQITLSEIKTFSLVATNQFMVALVEANDNTNKHVNILAKYIEKKQKWSENAITKLGEDNDIWKTQLVTEKNLPVENFSTVMTSVANVKKMKYMFLRRIVQQQKEILALNVLNITM